MNSNQLSEPKEWQELTKIAGNEPIIVERVRLPTQNLAIEGAFELPQLAKLNIDDQVFIVAFVRSHGSIKEMEQTFGISYPTVKARLSRIADSLEFVEMNAKPSKSEVIDRLKRGEITAQEAIAELEALK